MAQNIFVASLLFFSLLLSTCYGVSPQCVTFNATTVANANTNSSGFDLSVSPDKLNDSTVYTVSVNGNGNFTVTLVALSSSTPVGNWSGCNSSIQFVDAFLNAATIQENWTSPVSLSSVTINAYIANDTQTIVISKALSPAASTSTIAPTVNQTVTDNSNSTATSTAAPSSNTTGLVTNNSTVNATSSITVTTIKATTNTGCKNHSYLTATAAIQMLFLFMISKFLS